MTSENENVYVGIDLGTTFSSISFYNNIKKDIELVHIFDHTTIPSWINISDIENQNVLVGYAAKNDENIDYSCFDAKRLIGKLHREITADDMNKWPFLVSPTSDNENARNIIKMKHPMKQILEPFHPEEISAIVLRYLKKHLEARLNKDGKKEITYGKVVVCIPPSYGENERNATINAAKLAGFKNVELINEPTAAVMEYQRMYGNTIRPGHKILVVDFGGGTVDISCCEKKIDRIVVLKNGGLANLGGNEFDKAMTKVICDKIVEKLQYEIDTEEDDEKLDKLEMWMELFKTLSDGLNNEDENELEPEEYQEKKKLFMKMKRIAEEMKIELSNKTEASFTMDRLIDKYEFEEDTVSIERSEFETQCEIDGLYEEFEKKLLEVVNDNPAFTKQNTRLILLIGGTCQIPSVQDIIFKRFNRQFLGDKNFNGMEAVCKGACFRAMSNNVNIASCSFDEVLALPIGIEKQNYEFQVMIPSKTKLPAKQTKRFHTQTSEQKSAVFNVYSGPSQRVDNLDMTFVCQLVIPNLPSTTGEVVYFDVTMEMNENGTFEIQVEFVDTEGKKQNVKMESCIENEMPDELVSLMEHHLENFWP